MLRALQVDAPRWGKENMVIDNLDDIEPCRVDCDKDGGSTGEDFGFFGNMLALNVSRLSVSPVLWWLLFCLFGGASCLYLCDLVDMSGMFARESGIWVGVARGYVRKVPARHLLAATNCNTTMYGSHRKVTEKIRVSFAPCLVCLPLFLPWPLAPICQERGHIIDNLDDIDACSIDC